MLALTSTDRRTDTLRLAEELWREGRYDRAMQVLTDLRCSEEEVPCCDIVRAAIMAAIVEISAGHLQNALRELRSVASLLCSCDDSLRGKWHNNLAAVHALLRNHEQAFQEFTAASYYHGRAGEFKKVGEAENNLGILKVEANSIAEAYPHFEKALASCDDPTILHQVGDSMARAKLAEGKTLEAYDYAARSCAYFRQVGEQTLFEESAETLRRICEQIKFERECSRIAEALDKADGNPEEAAHILGISRQALDKKLNRPRYSHLKDKRQPYQRPRGKTAK